MTRTRRVTRLSTLAASAAAAAATAMALLPGVAQAQKPAPITLVVPYAPGGTTDMLGRLVAQGMGEQLGRTMIVENKPGAGTAIGASQVARAAPDGNTLLVATSTTLAINPWLYDKLPYDAARDFTPIGMIGGVPLLVVVHPDVKADSLAELVALAKANPEALSYGSAGNGSPQHLAAEMFKQAAGVQMTHVPYKGSAPALADLLGGQTQVMFIDFAPALPHVQAGKLRALGVTTGQRQAAVPQVPTVAESGIPGTAGFDAIAWQSVVGPADMPTDLVERYGKALDAVMSRPEVRQRLERDGLQPPQSLTPTQMADYVRSETERWGPVVKASGTRID